MFDFENLTSLCGPVFFKLPQNDRENCKMILVLMFIKEYKYFQKILGHTAHASTLRYNIYSVILYIFVAGAYIAIGYVIRSILFQDIFNTESILVFWKKSSFMFIGLGVYVLLLPVYYRVINDLIVIIINKFNVLIYLVWTSLEILH